MNTSPPSAPMRAVIISGITVHLAERLDCSLQIKFRLDDECPKILLERDSRPDGNMSLSTTLTLQENSTLAVTIKEKHIIRILKNRSYPHHISFEDILCYLESEACTDPTKYPLTSFDPKKQFFLDIVVVPSLSQLGLTPDVQGTAEALRKAAKSLQDFKTIFERLGGAKLDKGMKVTGAFGELHSTVKLVTGFVNIVYQEFKIHDQHHKELGELVKSMEGLLKFIPVVEEIAKFNELKNTIQSLYKIMNETVDFVKKWLAQNGIRKVLHVIESQDEIESLKKQYKALETAFHGGVVINTAVNIDHMSKRQDLDDIKARLGNFPEVKPQANPCLEGTRNNILDNIERMTKDLKDKNVIWIHGAPGSGKSSISLTIKSRLHTTGRLVTYFRFDRKDPALTPNALWRRIAYDLADRYPSVREYILPLLRGNRVDLISTEHIFTSLIKEPLTKLTDLLPDHPVVLIIDALDECGGYEGRSSADRKALLETLAIWPELPNQFKLVVTSRNEGDITPVVSPISTPIEILSGHMLTEDLHAKASSDASSDIFMYLEGRFKGLRRRFPSLPVNWPGTEIIKDMARRAAGIFMWATTATNFIESGMDPTRQLQGIMGDTSDSSSMGSLYALYVVILEMSFGRLGNNDSEVLRCVLGAVVLTKRPLEDAEYRKLPTTETVTQTRLDFIRDGLHSVVAPGALRFIHKSFDDFLLSKDCPSKFAVRIEDTQRLLAELCLKTMTTELRFNMCDLETSCLKNVDVPDIETKVANGIPALLSYACFYWADHLSSAPFNGELKCALKDMIFEKLLYWFEAMSLLKEINRVSHSLLSVLSWVKSASDEELDDFIRDAHRFIGAFGYPISQSAPHVYISALPFAPESSPIARRFCSRFPWILEVSVGKPTDWSPCVFTTPDRYSEAHSVSIVSFSPDEKYFVLGFFRDILICDYETGNLISGPFGDDRDYQLGSCFFDPDGRRIWASYKNSEVICWDIETGNKHLAFETGIETCWKGCCSNGGQNIVFVTEEGTVTRWNAVTGERLPDIFKIPLRYDFHKVSFSPDGGYLAWAAYDAASIHILDLTGGSEIHGSSHSQPHAGLISVLSFSVDGQCVVGGSEDGYILIWNTKTGDIIGEPLATSDCVDAVAYSHEHKVLVSASGDTGQIMVWNASTHELVLGPLEGHTSRITSIAVSRDGRKALSGSWDGTVRMWDLGKKGVVSASHPTEGHTVEVQGITFSSCGKRLASTDEKTIRIWDASTGEHLSVISIPSRLKLIFSPDGNQIMSFDSGDGRLRAWHVNTGEPAFDCDMRDDGHQSTRIQHVAFRSTDQRLVTCSSNGVVRLWSLEGNSLTEDLTASSPQPEDPTAPVSVVALSPDGSTAIVRDDKRRPRHYLWSTTSHQPLPFVFTDENHISYPKYLPSGKFFAAMSEGTRRVWSTETGQLVAPPSYPVFSADDCHAFSHEPWDPDQVQMWIWSALMASEFYNGHSDTISAFAFSPDQGKLTSGSWGGQIAIWKTTDRFGRSHASATGFLGVGAYMQDGWVMDTSKNILFWVPNDHRSRLVWPGSIKTMGGKGILTQLDLTKFKYGKNWTECFDRRQ